MQVGDDEQALRLPIKRAGEIGDERDAGNVEGADCATVRARFSVMPGHSRLKDGVASARLCPASTTFQTRK